MASKYGPIGWAGKSVNSGHQGELRIPPSLTRELGGEGEAFFIEYLFKLLGYISLFFKWQNQVKNKQI